MTRASLARIAPLAALVLGVLAAPAVSAHCDALDGPVVADARVALERADPALVLKWVNPEHEAEVRQAFQRARAIRGKGGDARELAELWFFETLVRLHRAGEGEAFTGLKPAGHIEPGLAAADAALREGSAAELAHHLGAAIAEGVTRRHKAALQRRAQADRDLGAGRAYVDAYVDYAHFVEAAHALAADGAGHGQREPAHER